MTTDAGTQQQQGDRKPEPWMADASTFGARLALVRQRMGWGNVKVAAQECGLAVESWRNWERDGMEPRRLVTIAMTIATRTGCDYLWLVHGPNRGGANEISDKWAEGHIVRRIGGVGPVRSSADLVPAERVADAAERPEWWTRSVRQTRPIVGGVPRSLSLSAP